MSLLNSFQPILLTSNIFGTLSTPLSRVKIIYQNIYTICILLIFSGVIFHALNSILSPTFDDLVMVYITDLIQAISSLIVAITFNYKALIGRKKLIKIFQMIDSVDDSFSKIQIFFDYKNISRNLIIQIILASISIIVASASMFLILPGQLYENSLMMIVYTFPVYLIFFSLILFSNLVHQLYLKYKKINKFLIQIKNECLEVSLIYKATKCYDEVNEISMMVNGLFGLTNLMIIS